MSPMDLPEIAVTVNGRRMLRIEDIAARAGITHDAAYSIVSRAKKRPDARIGNVYDEAEVELLLRDRPGKGGPGVPRPHRPPTA